MKASSPKKRGIERVVRVMMGQNHVRDLIRRLDQLPKGIEDRRRFWHHSRIDHDPDIALADEADRAGDAVANVTLKEDPEFGTHAPTIVRRASLSQSKAGSNQSVTSPGDSAPS